MSDSDLLKLSLKDEPEPEPKSSEESVSVPISPTYMDYQKKYKGDSEPVPEDKIDNDSLNKSYDPWPIIDTYFRDTKYYKSQHQVDSFDEFITSEENGIRKIIKRNNPLSIFKGEKSDKNFSYEMEIYFGETLDEATGDINKDVDGLHPNNLGLIMMNKEPLYYPCTPLSIIKLL